MKRAVNLLLFLLWLPTLLFLSSCGDDKDEKPIPNYLPNETIQNTFLWGYGSFWAYEDTVTGEQDTFYVSEHYSTKRNVFEGSTQIHSDYYYKGTLIRTKDSKKFILDYVSSLQQEYLGSTRTFLEIYSFQNSYGAAEEKLFYTPWNKGDSVWVGYEKKGSLTTNSYLTILDTGDSLFYENTWNKGKYFAYKISSSMANNFNDAYYTWQENVGLIEYNIDGRTFRLVDHLVLKP